MMTKVEIVGAFKLKDLHIKLNEKIEELQQLVEFESVYGDKYKNKANNVTSVQIIARDDYYVAMIVYEENK